MYRFARETGLRLTAHAGETTGPESIWGALRLGAERIGHGIRAIDDPALMRHLRDSNVPLEICISSNIATGAVRSLAEHPVKKLYDADVASAVRILYGGSVKPDNIAGIMAQSDVDGALVGGASIDADQFASIVRYREVPAE